MRISGVVSKYKTSLLSGIIKLFCIDSYEIYQDEIIGRVIYNIKYIGYPTIWINENFSKI